MKYQKPGITAVNIPVNMSRDSDERSSCYGGRCERERFQYDHEDMERPGGRRNFAVTHRVFVKCEGSVCGNVVYTGVCSCGDSVFVLDGNAEGVGYAVKTAAAGEDGTAKL